MSDSNTNWTEPPEPAAPATKPPPIVNEFPALTLADRINGAALDFWGFNGRKPTALYLGVFEHKELRDHAERIANFTIADGPGRLPKTNALFEYNGMRVFKVDVLSHVGVGR
jgi:hypothetical protein